MSHHSESSHTSSSERVQELQNYIDSLEEKNAQLSEEWAEQKQEKNKARRLQKKEKVAAANLRQKWHNERNTRRKVQDELTSQRKANEKAKEVMERYNNIAMESEESKRCMKME